MYKYLLGYLFISIHVSVHAIVDCRRHVEENSEFSLIWHCVWSLSEVYKSFLGVHHEDPRYIGGQTIVVNSYLVK